MVWNFGENKVVKITRSNRLAFQRKGRYNRGLTLSKDAFFKMEDVTIVPGTRIQLAAPLQKHRRYERSRQEGRAGRTLSMVPGMQ